MINFLKILLNLFSRTPTYSLGAEESPFDVRNISLAQIQKPVELPPEYETEMPFVENQGSKPKCVASAISKVKELYLKEKGKELDLSDIEHFGEKLSKHNAFPEEIKSAIIILKNCLDTERELPEIQLEMVEDLL